MVDPTASAGSADSVALVSNSCAFRRDNAVATCDSIRTPPLYCSIERESLSIGLDMEAQI